MNGHTLFFVFTTNYTNCTLSGLKIRAIRVIRGEKLLVVL